MNRFILRVHITAKFCLNIYLILHILHIHTDFFCVFSVYEQIHSTNSQYMYRFILCLQRMHPNNFEYSEWNYFLYRFSKDTTSKKYAPVQLEQLDQRTTRNNRLFGPSLTKKFLSTYSYTLIRR